MYCSRLDTDAPDADAIRARMQPLRMDLLQFGNLMVLGPEAGRPLSDAILTPLDADDRAAAAAAQAVQAATAAAAASAGGVAGGERGSTVAAQSTAAIEAPSLTQPASHPLQQQQQQQPGVDHWRWAVQQLHLTSLQRKLLAQLLLMWRSRMAQLTAARQALTAAAAQRAADAAAQEELVQRLRAVQSSYILNTTVFLLTAYSSILRAHQFARLMVSSFPWAPSMQSIFLAFQELGWLAQDGGAAGEGSAAATATAVATTAAAAGTATAGPTSN